MVIYKITNIKNNKCYVGQTTQNLTKRKSHHLANLKTNKHNNPHLQRSFNKYGEDAFKFEVLEQCDSIEELNKREKNWIKEIGYYNFQSGGKNFTLDEKTKEKISKTLKGVEIPRKVIEASIKSNSKEIHQYNLNGNYINTFSSIKEASKKTKGNASDICEVANNKYGRKSSGGFQWSYEKKDNIGEVERNFNSSGPSKKVIQYDLEENKINEFKSIAEAARQTNTSEGGIRHVVKGRNETSNNFKWKIKED